MNIYVGNLSLETSEDDLREAFAVFGQVRSVNIVRDRDGGESRGFGFVTMPSEKEAKSAINEMNGKDVKGQTIKVEEGRTKTRVLGGGGRGGRFGGSGRGSGRSGFGGSGGRGSARGGRRE